MSEQNLIYVWPPTLPHALHNLYERLTEMLKDCVVTPVTDLAEIGRIRSHGGRITSTIIVLDPVAISDAHFTAQFVAAVEGLRAARDINTVIIVGDGYLGTDTESLTSAMHAASAVSIVRSLALTRERPGRSNAVVVPDALIGPTGSQHGPLPQETDVEDIAHAVSFLIGPTGEYVSGQTLFVNSGRHLFSSQTS